jgi:peptide/nickel transport system ATP-binding protein
MSAALLEVRNLRLSVRTDEGVAQILDRVELALPMGRILGVVGESGCGKSTLVRAILGILPKATTVESGEILFEGENLLRLSERELARRVRGSRIGFIPQDPYLALNPVFKIGAQLLAVMRWHAPAPADGPRSGAALMRRHRARLVDILRRVQIPEPEAVLERYPHQFSGGQRQRLMIAGALACSPRLVIADEPTTALDVTTQLQILKLLKSLATEFDVSMLFVTHDFGVVAQLCDDITVMYAGQTVESGPTAAVLDNPKHPYTQALLACHPDRARALIGIPGVVPSPLKPPPGCRFAPRCPQAIEYCRRRPAHLVADGPDRLVNCRLAEPIPQAAA